MRFVIARTLALSSLTRVLQLERKKVVSELELD